MPLPTGPVVLFLAGVALMVVHLIGRRRRRKTTPEMRAGARFLWDLVAGSVVLTVFAGWMFAPRHVLPGQRIPRPKARRMVQAMDADHARKMIR
jgi:uncharacterized membrane protein